MALKSSRSSARKIKSGSAAAAAAPASPSSSRREPKLEYWDIDRPQPNPQNSKVHPIDQVDALASLILKVGFLKPIVVDDAGMVLAGHGALAAAKKAGLERVPVSICSHLTPAEKRAYVIADNRLPELSMWDKTKVSEELAALDLEKFDFTMTGFSDRDLEQMLDELAGPPQLQQHRGNRMTTEFNKSPQTPASNASVDPPKASAAAPAAAAATVDSASDARTVNSTDAGGNVMRHAYRVLTEDEKKLMVEVKDLGLALWNKIHAIDAAGSRELSVAKTKVEEAVMWATKHLTK